MNEARGVKSKELDVSLNAQLEDACAEFEAAWRRAVAGGPQPRLEAFVDGSPAAIKEIVRVQLREIEKRFRAHAGVTNSQSGMATELDCKLGDTATHTPVP